MKQLHMIGNAHLDLAWLWNWQEGFGEVKATFLSALQRLEEFDGFIFTSSSAQYYSWVEENSPELFEQIKRRVKEGRWVICGGWWVQPDCNLPCGESFVRQGLHAQQYFYSRFGLTARVGYNVDSFGHNAGLPQILQKSGLDSYMFLRPGTNEMDLPTGPFCWEGVDGSRVTACRIPTAYTSSNRLAEHIRDTMDIFPEEAEHFLCFYGVGNHGGGPTIENIRYIIDHAQITDDCRMVFSSPSRFLALAAKGELPVQHGELQHHAVGCYSAVSRIKALNRKAEHSLLAAEKFSVLSRMLLKSFSSQRLENAWEQLLTCQFHDILAGAAIREVCDAAVSWLGGVCAQADRSANHALQAVSFAVNIPYSDNCQPLVVFNPHSWAVRTVIAHEKGTTGNAGIPSPCRVVDSRGTTVVSQFLRTQAQLEDRRRIAFLADLPPLGYETFYIISDDSSNSMAGPDSHPVYVLENTYIRAELCPDTGALISLFDKTGRTELLRGPSAIFLARTDTTDTWSHGTASFEGDARPATLMGIYRLEDGPLLESVMAVYRYGGSLIRQTFTLRTDSPILESAVSINWQESLTALELSFSTALSDPHALWEIPYGTVYRPVNGHEEPMQGWVDITGLDRAGHTRGLAFTNNGKYAAHADGSTLGITVLRSPVYAFHDPHQLSAPIETYDITETGLQEFCYQLIPHSGSWQDGRVLQEALLLNQPAVKVVETFHDGPLPPSNSGISISEENIILSCLKPAYDGDGFILRLYEAYGRDTQALIGLPLTGQELTVHFSPFEAKTYRLDPSGSRQPAECTMTEFPNANENRG